MAAEGGHDPQPECVLRPIRFRGGPGSQPIPLPEISAAGGGHDPQPEGRSDRTGFQPAPSPARFACHVVSVSTRPTLLSAHPGDAVHRPLPASNLYEDMPRARPDLIPSAQSRLLGRVLIAEGVGIEPAPSRVFRFQGGDGTMHTHLPVQVEGFEPPASRPPAGRASRLHHTWRMRSRAALPGPARTTLPRREHPVAEAPGVVGKLSPLPEPRASRRSWPTPLGSTRSRRCGRPRPGEIGASQASV